MEQNNPANKIVKTGNLSNRSSLRMFKAIAEGVPKKEADAARRRVLKKTARSRMKAGRMRYWKPDYLKEKNPGDPRLQKMSKSARNTHLRKIKSDVKRIMGHADFKKMAHQKGWNPISFEKQFKQFQAVDDAIKLSSEDYQPKGSKGLRRGSIRVSDAVWKRMHNAAATKHVNKLTSSYRYFDYNLGKLKKERNRLTFELNKKLKAGITAPNIPKSSRLKGGMSGGVKGDLMSTAAYILADVLGERVIDPLTKKLVEKTLGPTLKKLREKRLSQPTGDLHGKEKDKR